MYSVFALIISVFLSLPLISTKHAQVFLRVVNGKPATLGQIPYQVSFKSRGKAGKYKSFCGGSLIGAKKILSAAHCFMKIPNACQKACKIVARKNYKAMYAVAGTIRSIGYYKHDSEGTEQWRRIARVIVHDNYTPFPKNDISLVFTQGPFVINNYVKVLPIAELDQDYGTPTCVVSGYGRISETTESEILLWAEVQLIPMRECSIIHERNMDNAICTSPEISDLRQGDSGGPLVCNNTGDPHDEGQGVIVGIVSGATWNEEWGGWHTFFTRVTRHKKFYLRNEATTNVPKLLHILCLCIVTNYIVIVAVFILFDF